ncbi:MAG: hypothetical protein PVI57_02655 [Gemmatimonadota bacterium]|jgi:hypothetical protein
MRARRTTALVLGIALVAVIALLLDRQRRPEEEYESTGTDAPADVEGLWRADERLGDGAGANLRGRLVHAGGQWGLVLVRLDDDGRPRRADVEFGHYRAGADTLWIGVEGIVSGEVGGAAPDVGPSVRVPGAVSDFAAAVEVGPDRLAATFPDGAVYRFHREDPAPGPGSRGLGGVWEARALELERGPEYGLAGRLFLGRETWLVAYFVVDSTGTARRAAGEHGTWRVAADTLYLSVDDRVTYGEPLPGLPVTPFDAALSVDEDSAVPFERSGATLRLLFPGWGRIVFERPGAAPA